MRGREGLCDTDKELGELVKTNEWGEVPGTQENITTDTAPMLSEKECDLVNLFRALPSNTGQRALQMMFALAYGEHTG